MAISIIFPSNEAAPFPCAWASQHMDKNSFFWGAERYMMGCFVCQGDFKPFSLFSNNSPMPMAGTTKHENNQMVGDIFIKGLT